MRLIYVKAIELNQFHMVLAYYPTPSSEPLILDNINPEIVTPSVAICYRFTVLMVQTYG